MRYQKLRADIIDTDYFVFDSGDCKGDIVLVGTDELIELTNNIRKERGYTDLVEIHSDNDVYYNFYLMFDIKKQEVSIEAVCNYGEKDDEVWYKLPMTLQEKEYVMFFVIDCLVKELELYVKLYNKLHTKKEN